MFLVSSKLGYGFVVIAVLGPQIEGRSLDIRPWSCTFELRRELDMLVTCSHAQNLWGQQKYILSFPRIAFMEGASLLGSSVAKSDSAISLIGVARGLGNLPMSPQRGISH